jgi:hypothetical protein
MRKQRNYLDDQTLHGIMSEQVNLQPERRLLWAMLKRWILDYTGACSRTNREAYPLEARFDAVEWAWSDTIEPFSYLWVCDTLGLDAGWLRRSADKTATRAELLGPLLGRIGSIEI